MERHGDGRWSFELTPGLTRFDGKLYGGTGIAVTTAAMEAESGRGALYATVQFAGSADVGERIDCHVEVLARGRRTSQLRLTATVDNRIVLAAVGATAEVRPDHSHAHFAEMPDVAPPQDSAPWRPNAPFPIDHSVPSWLTLCELREVAGAMRDDGRPLDAMWGRMRNTPMSRATLGFLADMVPSAVVRAAGKMGGGTSLDNAMRFGPPPETEWVLVEFVPYMASNGYAHGAALLWSAEGVLLGVADQTATMLVFDPDAGPPR